MSDKRPDERDIDEILASIDEMLSQKQPYTLQDDGRKDSVKEGVKASEDTLGLSSSVDLPDLSEFDQVDIDEFLSLGMPEQQSAVETKQEESIAEKNKTEVQDETNIQEETDIVHHIDKDAAQDIDEHIDFTLDEIDLPNFDEAHSSNQEENTDEQETQTPEVSDNDDIPLSSEKPQKPTDTNTTDEMLHDDIIEHHLDEDCQNNDNLDENSLDETELVHNEAQADTSTTEEDNTPRHRILLTEELLEPSAQEALPLWIEQDSNKKENLEESDDTAGKHETVTPEALLPEFTAAKPTPTKDPHSNPVQTATLETGVLETEKSKLEETKADSKTEEIKAKYEPQQHVSNVDMQQNTTNADVPTDKDEAKITPTLADEENAKVNSSVDEPTHISKDDAMVFDLDEDIGVDTVYKLETLAAPSDDDLDNHTELVEVMMEEVLQDDNEQSQDTEQLPEKEIKKVFLSDDEMQNMVQAVSADVAQQINDHLQTWLPGLISIAIKNHIKDLNNKD